METYKEIIDMIWPNNTPVAKPNVVGADIAQKAYEAQQMRKKFEAEERMHLDALKSLAKGQSCTFGVFVLVKELRAGSVDYKAIPELLSVNLEEYRKEQVSVWKLSKMGD